MPRYRAVFFDLDGTLVDERVGVSAARAAGAEALRSLGYDVPDEDFDAAIQLVVGRTFERYGGQWPGIWSREELMADVLRELGLSIAVAARIADAYAAARIENLALVQGARQTLALLSRLYRSDSSATGPGRSSAPSCGAEDSIAISALRPYPATLEWQSPRRRFSRPHCGRWAFAPTRPCTSATTSSTMS